MEDNTFGFRETFGEALEQVEAEAVLVNIRPSEDTRVQALYNESLTMLDDAKAREIMGDDGARIAADFLNVIAGLKKRIEAARKEYVDPLNNHLFDVNAAFKTFMAPLLEADEITRGKVMAYRKKLEDQRLEQERINRLREEAAQAEMKLKGELTEPGALVEVLPEAPTQYRGVMADLGTVKTWKFEVVDFGLLPEEYKMIDSARVKKIIQAGGTIPGVRAWQEESLRVTGGR